LEPRNELGCKLNDVIKLFDIQLLNQEHDYNSRSSPKRLGQLVSSSQTLLGSEGGAYQLEIIERVWWNAHTFEKLPTFGEG